MISGLRRWTAARVTRVVRRVHMYAGLAMFPWAMFFGLSGMLFNHPTVGEDVRGMPVSPQQLAELDGLQPWRPGQVAEHVVRGINEAAAGGPYRLDPEFDPSLDGAAVLGAEAPQGRYMLLLDLQTPRGVLVRRKRRPTEPGAVFPAKRLRLPEALSLDGVEQRVQGLLEQQGLPVVEPLRLHPAIAPQLRLRVLDAQDQRWNLVVHMRSGEVSGRRADRWSSIGPSQLLASLHTTHHFPPGINALWFWALFEDLLGLTLIFWGLSGLVMWWQVRRTRIAGLVSVAFALALATAVMAGAANHAMFGHVEQQLGPGGP